MGYRGQSKGSHYSKNRRSLNVFDSHRVKIAEQTLRMPDAISNVMGGMEKGEAIEYLTKMSSDGKIKLSEDVEREIRKEHYKTIIPKNKPKAYDVVLKALDYLKSQFGDRPFNYWDVQATTGVFGRKIPIDTVHYIAFRFLEPQGKIKIITDTNKWNGERFKYQLA